MINHIAGYYVKIIAKIIGTMFFSSEIFDNKQKDKNYIHLMQLVNKKKGYLIPSMHILCLLTCPARQKQTRNLLKINYVHEFVISISRRRAIRLDIILTIFD